MGKKYIFIISICYTGTALITILTILNYINRRDEMLLFSQLLLVLVALINSIVATIKYKK